MQLQDITLCIRHPQTSKLVSNLILYDWCLDVDLSQSFLVSLGGLAHLAGPVHLRNTRDVAVIYAGKAHNYLYCEFFKRRYTQIEETITLVSPWSRRT